MSHARRHLPVTFFLAPAPSGSDDQPLRYRTTGEGFTVDGTDIFTIEAGKITEVYTYRDTLKMVYELGVVSTTGSTIG